MERRKFQWPERKRSPLAIIARKTGMMRTIAENCSREETEVVQRKEREANSCSNNTTN
jgi:hypothetical protein